MRTHALEVDVWLPHPRGEVFAFFADPSNLELITPPWLSFRVVTSTPIEMKAGTRIEYRLKLRGIPIRWKSEITVWEPPGRFVDVQRRGPYRLWVHEHTFVEKGNGTVVRDSIRYAVPGGEFVNRFLVRPDLDRIFSYRRCKLVEIFSPRP